MAAGASGRVGSYASHTSCANARMTSGRLIHSDLMVGSALRTYALSFSASYLSSRRYLYAVGMTRRRSAVASSQSLMDGMSFTNNQNVVSMQKVISSTPLVLAV